MIERGFEIKGNPIDIEKQILITYWQAIGRVLNGDVFWYTYTENAGIDIYANKFLWAGYTLADTNRRRLYIADEYLLNKYAAYIWHDHYIYPELGMLLNNADSVVKANCFFEDGIIKTMRDIQKGEFLRIDYGYKELKYPPIPDEIIKIRQERLKLKENIKAQKGE